MIRLALVLVAIVLAVVFAAQNADVVNLSLLGWNLDASLAVIIVLCFAAGALITAFAMMPSIYRIRTELRKTKLRVAELESGAEPIAREDARSPKAGGTVADSTETSTAAGQVVLPPDSKAPRAQESW